MRKGFNFYMDFPFWRSRNDHFDRSPQFTSNLWLKQCKMLHTSHKRTTA
jgi:hypothetical protein